MTNACVLPFPRARDRGFILRHATIMAEMSSAERAEAHLQRQIETQRRKLESRGVLPELATVELHAIEGNIRAAIWRLLLAPEGVA